MSDNIFQTTMIGLETGLHVHHIATLDNELLTCNIDDKVNVETLFAERQFEGIDQVPVRQGKSIVGVITRECQGVIHPLDESMLISAQEPITKLIPLIAEHPPYRLVLLGGRIRGIVTRSDLLKLPVRLFVFTLVTHLELLMADIIRTKYPNSQDELQWLQFLNRERQEKVKENQQSRKRGNLDLPLLEFTDFCDKRDIVRKIFSLPSRRKFKDDLEKIEKYLRNPVAHAASYAQNDQEMK